MAEEDSELESYQYPNAHIGHLTDYQQNQLNEFKRLVKQESSYVPSSSGEHGITGHDDETLLRYLRARKFNPLEALEQFKETQKWRKENQLEKLYSNIELNDYEQTRQLYPQWTGRRDKRGIPIYVYEIAHLNQKKMTAYGNSVSSSNPASSSNASLKMLRLFALYENLTRFTMPLCSAMPDRAFMETPISQSNNIVDISKVGLKQFWNLKQHMQDASTLATAHYPETLDRIFIIGAPSFFPTVWGWIKKWFDPITVSKIFILSSSTLTSSLEEYIDPENIPKKYGGKLDFTYGMLPILEPAFDGVLKWENPEIQNGQRTIPSGPVKWEKSPEGELSAIAVGCENGVPRNKVVARIPPSSPKIEQKTLRAAPPGLFRTTTGVSTHPVVSDDADLYNDENPPLDDDESMNMQSGTSSPHHSGYTVVDSSNRAVGSAPMTVPVTSASSSLSPANASMVSATSATSDTSSTAATTPVVILPPSTAPSMTASYASSDLSASSHSTISTQMSKDQGTRSETIDDGSSTSSRSKSKMGGSVYRSALNKATRAMESVGLVIDRKSSPTPKDSTNASVSSPPMSPPMSPPSHSQNDPSINASSASIASSNKTAASAKTEVGAGAGAGTGTGTIDKRDVEEVLRNKYASGKH